MRSRWEERERAEAAIDEPVTITERELRSLKRGATLGLCGLILAVMAAGLAAWTLVEGPQGTAGQGAMTARTPPPETSTSQTATPVPAPMPDSVRSAAAPTAARHSSRVAAAAATARAQRGAIGQKPEAMQATDLISKPAPSAISIPKPVAADAPKAAAAPKPAARDTAGAAGK